MNETSGICQSCSMPMMSQQDYGTESDGTVSKIYCKYCYHQGKFTNPEATVETIADHGAKIMSDMYLIPADNAKNFMIGQIKMLYRWSGRIIPYCQSCGMPIFSDEDAGTEKDGLLSNEYCTHCYQKGKFVEEQLTHEDMIKKCYPMIAAHLKIPDDKAEKMVRVFTSNLKRWK